MARRSIEYVAADYLTTDYLSKGYLAVPDAPSFPHAIISFFFPPLGLLTYMLLYGREPQRAASSGKGATLGLILLPILFFVFTSIFSLSVMDALRGAIGGTAHETSRLTLPTTSSSDTSSVPDTQSTTQSDLKAQVRAHYEGWKQSWEDKDIGTFMSFYDPAAHISDADGDELTVRALRARRLKNLKQWSPEARISITDSDPAIEITGDTATVTFTRNYESSTQKYSRRKAMAWRKSGRQWLILDERFIQG